MTAVVASGVLEVLADRLGDVGAALARSGWAVAFLAPVAGAYPLEARKGGALVYVPRGARGEHAPSVHSVDADGGSAWCCALSPATPGDIVVQVAEVVASANAQAVDS